MQISQSLGRILSEVIYFSFVNVVSCSIFSLCFSSTVNRDFVNRQNEIIKDEVLEEIAAHINGKDMFFVALELDLTAVKIEQHEEYEPRDTVRRNRRILKDWKKNVWQECYKSNTSHSIAYCKQGRIQSSN